MPSDDQRTDMSDAVWKLFDGVVPERNDELRELFDLYHPQFRLVGDLDKDVPAVIMRGGSYVLVEANHRVFRLFWYGCYVVWDAYTEGAHALLEGREVRPKALRDLLGLLQQTLRAPDPTEVKWPARYPEPGNLRPAGASNEVIAAGELATFASAWALLHELKHLQHQQEGTSSTYGSLSEKHGEELDCDRYAARFLLDQIDAYSKSTGDDPDKVRQKRRLGIVFGLLVLSAIKGQHQDASETHPSSRERLLAMIREIDLQPESAEVGVLLGAVEGLAAAGIEPL